jgi:peptide/nickel transport system substrate-binding protein
MDEQALRGLIGEVKDGRTSRRSFVQRMVALGLTAPMAAQMLAYNGVANAAAEKFEYKPTKRGGGGALKLLWWQGPTLLNPHFAVGTKDSEGSRIFYEPLAGWDPDGELYPVLASEVPTRQNGGVSADGLSVTWKLKRGVRWHDGKPFTADDVVFTAAYAADPETASVSIGSYKDIKVEKVDDFTVVVRFKKPMPFWADALVGARGMILPKHLFADYTGTRSRDAPTNLKPVGTGPYRFVDFRPGDLVRGELNPDYHVANVRTSTRSSSRAAAMRYPPRAPCCKPASTTSPGTCRSRTKSCCASKEAARAASCSRTAPRWSTSSSTSPTRGPRSMASAPASRRSIPC